MGLFEKGREKTGGRTSGTRNKFSRKFDDALLKDFEEHGEAAIKIARIERPTEYLKLIASRFPIEFQFTDSRLKDLSDDELEFFIAISEYSSEAMLQALTAETGAQLRIASGTTTHIPTARVSFCRRETS